MKKRPLRDAVREQTEHALRVGALAPIPTEPDSVEDRGVRFQIRVASSLARKELAARRPSRSANPFLPYDDDLFVADVSETHVALLNKYPVLEHHLLLVTRRFEDQESPLTRTDFVALVRSMTEFDGLGFYNSGRIAGASQPHKHIQLVPLPMTTDGPRVPIEPLLSGIDAEDAPRRSETLPFENVVVRREEDAGSGSEDEQAGRLLGQYRSMLAAAGLDDERPRPYNLLVTRDWLLLVPRRREHYRSISVNALGFAGSFFVKDRRERDLLVRAGPAAVLKAVAGGAFAGPER